MCECGCGNFSGDLTFPAPGGDVYVLDVYPGCEDCDAPAGVVLYRFTPKEATSWGVESRAPLAVTQDGVGIPVLDGSVLHRLATKEAAAEMAEVCRDVLSDALRRQFREAAIKTYATWRKRRDTAGKGGSTKP